jgi:hypothetical protein
MSEMTHSAVLGHVVLAVYVLAVAAAVLALFSAG